MDRTDFAQLVRKVSAGDALAYRTLLEESARLVRAYLSVKMSGPARADLEDLVQETLLAVHLKYHSYRASMPFTPWLRTIAHHKLVDHWRRKKLTGAIPLEDDLIEAPGDDAAQTDTTITLEQLMTVLNDKQRDIVTRARIDGKSMEEIAREMNLTVSDVKVTLHRALKKLSSEVKRDSHAYG